MQMNQATSVFNKGWLIETCCLDVVNCYIALQGAEHNSLANPSLDLNKHMEMSVPPSPNT